MAREQPSILARYLFVAYLLLVVYASLHPFSGWRDRGLPAFAFLTASFNRPMPAFDVFVNVLGYLPLGFLAVLAAYPRLRGASGFAFAVACAALLSFILESLQLYLPTRTASNLDLLANTAKHTRPYRPQTNGKIERFHRTPPSPTPLAPLLQSPPTPLRHRRPTTHHPTNQRPWTSHLAVDLATASRGPSQHSSGLLRRICRRRSLKSSTCSMDEI